MEEFDAGVWVRGWVCGVGMWVWVWVDMVEFDVGAWGWEYGCAVKFLARKHGCRAASNRFPYEQMYKLASAPCLACYLLASRWF